MSARTFLWLSLSMSLLASSGAAAPDPPAALTAEEIDLARRVLDVFKNPCIRCHTPEAEKIGGGFDFILDLRRLAADEKFVVPFKPEESEIFLIVEADQMPPKESGLGPIRREDKETIRRWIELGAKSPEPEHAGDPGEPMGAASHGAERPFFSIDRFLAWIGHFHVASVHFPIALLLCAFLAEALLLKTRRESFKTVVRFCLWVGCASAVLAAALGWTRAEYGIYVGETKQWTLLYHRWLGVAAAAWALVAAIASDLRIREDSPRHRVLVRVAVALCAALAAATGAFGGALIHGWDHYMW